MRGKILPTYKMNNMILFFFLSNDFSQMHQKIEKKWVGILKCSFQKNVCKFVVTSAGLEKSFILIYCCKVRKLPKVVLRKKRTSKFQ